jgi:hypothetical protein
MSALLYKMYTFVLHEILPFSYRFNFKAATRYTDRDKIELIVELEYNSNSFG